MPGKGRFCAILVTQLSFFDPNIACDNLCWYVDHNSNCRVETDVFDGPLVDKYEWIEGLEKPETPDEMSQQIHIKPEERFDTYAG